MRPFFSLPAKGRGSIVALIAALALAQAALADSRTRPGIIGPDDRKPVIEGDHRWDAVGQVNIGGYRTRGMCSGTLVAPQVVVTAAHCLHDAAKKTPFRLENIHFAAGVFRDTKVGEATARCLKFPPGFSYRGPGKLLPDLPSQRVAFGVFKSDLGVIVLDKPIRNVTPIPLAEESLQAGLPLIHVSYGVDRRYIASVQENCRVLAVQDGVVVNDCDAHFGSSGGPVFSGGRDSPRLAAVMVGVSMEGIANFAAPLRNWTGLPLEAACP